MNVIDPLADMFTRIRNANLAYHDTVDVPYSNIKLEVAKVLAEEGYIASYKVKESKPENAITITLKYMPNKKRVITGIKRISKPGLRVYAKQDAIPKVLGGLGIAVLSSSRGIMTDKRAREVGVGGEVIAYVW
ncbi:MAG: 30S ribosomal protein S8 [Actinomycetota bacterium]